MTERLQQLQNLVNYQDSLTFLPSNISKSLMAMTMVAHYQGAALSDLVAYSKAATHAFKLPNDIKAYLDGGASARMDKRGVQKSREWLETQSNRAKAVFQSLPVPYYKIDTSEKRDLLADQLAMRCNALLHSMTKNCFDYKAGALALIEQSGVMHWQFAFVPNFTKVKNDDYWLGVIARLIDPKWWNRKISRAFLRTYEDARRAAGMVSPDSGNAYCSKGQLSFFKQKLENQEQWLNSNVMRRADGLEISLKDIYAASVANPEVRRAELMTRINGMSEIAEERGFVGLFTTHTAPSRFHRKTTRKTKNGVFHIDNPKYDGSSVRDAQVWLSKRWALIRSALNDANIEVMGFRVAEPHADGCPHWHMLLFVAPWFAKQAEQIMRQYMHLSNKGALRAIARGCQTTKHDRLELNSDKAKNARFDCKTMKVEKDENGNVTSNAAIYIAKYIAKNIDAHNLDGEIDFETGKKEMKENALRVRAWASVHGIRQFQQIGGAPVTVWRELRRITSGLESPKFEKMRRAAGLRGDEECASYAEYTRLNRFGCVRLLKVAHENGYGEATNKIVGLEGLGLEVLTHVEQWEIAHASSSLESSEAAFPWINENNCRTGLWESGKPLNAAAKYTLLEMEIERPSLSNWDEESF